MYHHTQYGTQMADNFTAQIERWVVATVQNNTTVFFTKLSMI